MRVVAVVLDRDGAMKPPGPEDLDRLARRYVEQLIRSAYSGQQIQISIHSTPAGPSGSEAADTANKPPSAP